MRGARTTARRTRRSSTSRINERSSSARLAAWSSRTSKRRRTGGFGRGTWSRCGLRTDGTWTVSGTGGMSSRTIACRPSPTDERSSTSPGAASPGWRSRADLRGRSARLRGDGRGVTLPGRWKQTTGRAGAGRHVGRRENAEERLISPAPPSAPRSGPSSGSHFMEGSPRSVATRSCSRIGMRGCGSTWASRSASGTSTSSIRT